MKQSSSITSSRNELRLKVLRELESNPQLSQRMLAENLGVSLGGVNYAIQALVDKGFIKADNLRRSDNKAAYIYLLTPSGLAKKTQLATAFLGRKLKEYDILKQEIETLKAETRIEQKSL